jgi:hypothetical protein
MLASLARWHRAGARDKPLQKEDDMSRRSGKEVEAIVSAMGVFSSFITSLVELVKKFGGSVENIYRLATPEGNETLEAIARLMVSKTGSRILKLISGGESLIIDATDGIETLADAKGLFDSIDPNFKNWGADERGNATVETPVGVYEMANNATFVQMFGELSLDAGDLCLTQDQIKNFARKYRGWLRTGGYATFFLLESRGQFFVADVLVDSGGTLHAVVDRFGCSDDWCADVRHRVVVPQLA